MTDANVISSPTATTVPNGVTTATAPNAAPAKTVTNGAPNGAMSAAANGGAMNGMGGDPLAGLPDDIKAHPALAAYRKGEAFDLGGLAKEHIHLQALIGKKGIVPPGDKDGPEAWARFYDQLGRPPKPELYQFAKPQDFAGYSDALADAYRAAAHEQGLTARQAAAMHDWFVQASHSAERGVAERSRRESDALDQALRQKWGAQYDAMVASGRRAARAFAPPAVIDELERAIGGPALMEMFAGIGERMREDGLIGGGSGFGLAPEQAKAEIARMDAAMHDPQGPAMNKLHPEHASWMRRREQLFAAAYPS